MNQDEEFRRAESSEYIKHIPKIAATVVIVILLVAVMCLGGNWVTAVVGIFSTVCLARIWGPTIAEKIATATVSFIAPTDWTADPLPRHSIADARAQQGKYAEAIEEFRRVLVEHPHDLYSRLRLVEIYSKYLRDHERALAEMALTTSLPLPPEKFALAANRLADLHLEAGDTESAKTALRGIIEKLPQSRAAQIAQERLASIVPQPRRAEDGFEVRL